MKCPKCKEQTMKEDYRTFLRSDDRLYCPNCGYTSGRRNLEKNQSEYLPDTTTLADVMESWLRSKNLTVPERDTKEWQKHYEAWCDYAFERCDCSFCRRNK